MRSYADNEDAGDLSAMNAADASECQELCDWPECSNPATQECLCDYHWFLEFGDEGEG